MLPGHLRQVGQDMTGADRVAADAVLCKLDCHGTGQRDHAALRCAVDRAAAQHSGVIVRADIDDIAGSAPVHFARDRLAEEEHALEIGIHDTVIGFRLDVEQAEVVEKPKTVVLESVQSAQTPPEPTQNVIVLEQEPPAAAYTQSTPVEEICRQMTYEQAQNVIVDCGTCKGWTLAQVADRRPASLRRYVKGYQGENNVLRAAAAIIWDSLQEKQAG